MDSSKIWPFVKGALLAMAGAAISALIEYVSGYSLPNIIGSMFR